MQCSLCLIPKLKFTDPTISDHHLISKTMKNDGRSEPSETTKDGAEAVTNTKSYGKAIRLPRQRGNRPRVLKMEEKKFFKNTDTASTSIPPKMDNKIYTFTLVNPEGKETLLTTTQYIPKKVWHASAYPHPDLAPPMDEE